MELFLSKQTKINLNQALENFLILNEDEMLKSLGLGEQQNLWRIE